MSRLTSLTGLKTGFGADATLFSSIFGYAILKGFERSKV